MIESKKLNGKVKNITVGIRIKTEKDRREDSKKAGEALKAAQEAVKAAEAVLETKSDVEDIEVPKGARKPSVRPSSK